MNRAEFLPAVRTKFTAAGLALGALALAGCGITNPAAAPPLVAAASFNFSPMPPMAPIPAPSQFDKAEAMAMIEFCVDLDSEDDRTASPRHIYWLRADRSLDLWTCIADSRGLYGVGANATDPRKNGFPPFDSAWTLWRRTVPAPDGTAVYALAFRGTVMSNDTSVIEDALSTTVAAHRGLELPAKSYIPLTFAALPGAEVHAGFAYGVFGALFDGKYGALSAVHGLVPPGSTLILTGHSQGAGLATLTHAFFHYAAYLKQFGVAEMNLKLRSYVFAQPKPGNLQFALDFSQVCSGGATAFVFNNTLDPVPMLPPTHVSAEEAFANLPGSSTVSRLARTLGEVGSDLHGAFADVFENSIARKVAAIQQTDQDHFLFGAELRADSRPDGAKGGSLSYTTVGNQIPLLGFEQPQNYYGNPADANDAFVQHHASSYRRLLEIMFSYDVTTETSPQLARPPPHVTAVPPPLARPPAGAAPGAHDQISPNGKS